MNELVKQAQALAVARMSYLQVAILDPDIYTAQLIRKSLGGVGITQTVLSRNSKDMLNILAEREIDMLIMERDSRPINGIDMTYQLRSPESPNRMLPIILTTSHNEPEEHARAINAGVNDVLQKPFNMRTIVATVIGIIDNPKNFIVAKEYVGPCRRKPGPPPPDIAERRNPENIPLVIPRAEVTSVFADDRPRLIKPDYSLKKRIESSTTKMAGIDHILSSSSAQNRTEDYVQSMLGDVMIIKQTFKSYIAAPQNLRPTIERITSASQSIRTRGLRAGYVFAARVATGLSDFCQKRFKPEDPHHILVVEKYIETLQAILNHKVAGDDHPVARELTSQLQLLVKKYS